MISCLLVAFPVFNYYLFTIRRSIYISISHVLVSVIFGGTYKENKIIDHIFGYILTHILIS